MKNIELLIKQNGEESKKNFKLDYKRKIYTCNINKTQIGDQEILYVIEILDSFYKTVGRSNIPLELRFGKVEFKDKLVYIILECIVYYYAVLKNRNLLLSFDVRQTINTDGFNFSPLLLSQNGNCTDVFKKHFISDISDEKHFRIIIDYNLNHEDRALELEKVFSFLNNNKLVGNKIADRISNVINELTDNSFLHGKSDTLIDIDITNNWSKRNDDSLNSYYGINVVVAEFSDILFSDPLKKRMSSLVNKGKKYCLIDKAYENHKRFFGTEYSQEDFYTISSFQDGISGTDIAEIGMGGTGLTILLGSIEHSSDASACYMLSGNRALHLIEKFLKKDINGFVSFNEEIDYINCRPNLNLFSMTKTHFPGVAYNLSYVLKKEDSK